MANQRVCFGLRCNFVTSDNIDYCPNCGRRLRSASQVRVLGWVQAILGLFLITVMGIITFNLWPSLMYPGEMVAGHSRFTGTPDQARLVLALFGTVILFGIVSLTGGVIQIATSRRSRVILILTLVLVIPLVALGIAVSRSMESSGSSL